MGGMNKQENYDLENNTKQISGVRFWEIDFFRGLAVILMLGLHFLDDLYFFYGYQVGISLFIWHIWQKITAITFILLVGISLTFKLAPADKKPSPKVFFRKLCRRGLVIFGWGIIITVVTKIVLQEGFIIFGVLHLIGISTIISYPFLNLKYWNLLLGIIWVCLGVYLNHLQLSFSWLLWAGFADKNFFSVDYFPVFPWFGVVLLGIFIGHILYRENQRKFPLKDLSRWRPVKWFCFLGKNSLLIYLLHQPLFVFMLYLLQGK